jgi:DHA2 family multidrug resistance protein
MASARASGGPVRVNHPLGDRPYYKWLATTAVMFGMMGSVMSSTMVNITIPDVMGAYGIGQDQAHWLSTAFLCAMPVTMLTNGWFVINFGARTTFIWACVVFCLASVVGQVMPNYWGLVLVRTVQGACGGLLQPLTMTIIFPLFPPAERGRAMAIYFMGFILGPALGPTFGGFIVDYAHWQDVFGWSIPLMALSAVLGARFLPYRDADAVKSHLNWVSLGLVASCIGTFLTAISNGQRFGWDSPFVFGLFFLCAVSFVAFVTVELYSRAPLLDMRLFAVRSFTLTTIVGVILGAGMFGSLYLLPIYAQTVLDYTAVKAGLLLMVTGFLQLPVYPIGGRLAQQSRIGLPISAGMIFFAISSVVLASTDVNSGFWYIAIWAAFGRIGLGLALPSLQIAAMRDLPPELVAYGAGTLSFLRMTGAAVGTNVLAVTLEHRTVFHSDHLAATQTLTNPETAVLLDRVGAVLSDQQGIGPFEQSLLALHYLGQVITAQAQALAFQDGFMLLAIGFGVAGVSALALAGKRRETAVPAAASSTAGHKAA